MNRLKKCFGIISGFPSNAEHREKRITRFNQLLHQLEKLWPEVDILVVAQNWKDYTPPKIKNKILLQKHENLIGILNARYKLRDWFLGLDYDYIIMMDDDVIIETTKNAHIKYMEEIDKHPDGFCFIHSENHWHKFDDYAKAPLNLCAISKYIYQNQNIPPVDLQKSEGLEDDTYAALFHEKWKEHEFIPPEGISHVQFADYSDKEGQQKCPSIWMNFTIKQTKLTMLTMLLLAYMHKYKDFPPEELWNEVKVGNAWKKWRI